MSAGTVMFRPPTFHGGLGSPQPQRAYPVAVPLALGVPPVQLYATPCPDVVLQREGLTPKMKLMRFALAFRTSPSAALQTTQSLVAVSDRFTVLGESSRLTWISGPR